MFVFHVYTISLIIKIITGSANTKYLSSQKIIVLHILHLLFKNLYDVLIKNIFVMLLYNSIDKIFNWTVVYIKIKK